MLERSLGTAAHYLSWCLMSFVYLSFSSWPLFAMCSKAAPAQRFPCLRPPDCRQNRLFSYLNLFFLETASAPQTYKHCGRQTSASSSTQELHSLKQHMVQQGLLVAGRLLAVERYLMGQRGEIFHPGVRGPARNERDGSLTFGLTGS